jgi:N-acetylglutamate synthase-like GNAT family acetyltransferase
MLHIKKVECYHGDGDRYVIKDDNLYIGSLHVNTRYSTPLIHTFEIEEDSQNKGYGQHLLKVVCDRLKGVVSKV